MAHKTAAELGIHLPAPTPWPAMVTVGVGLIPTGILAQKYFMPEHGMAILWIGVLLVGFTLMGWCHQVIQDKNEAHTDGEIEQQKNDLTLATKLMLVSEAAIFGGLFVHFFYNKDYAVNLLGMEFRPEGLLETSLPAIGTLLLISSSFTCHVAHHAFEAGNRGKAKTYLVYTMVLGLIFLGMQGYEWGHLAGLPEPFTAASGVFGTCFYLMTGFHGAHVAMGIMMLFLVYARMEMNHMTEKRHFSMVAASWYWHFVDVVWIVLFFTVYLI